MNISIRFGYPLNKLSDRSHAFLLIGPATTISNKSMIGREYPIRATLFTRLSPGYDLSTLYLMAIGIYVASTTMLPR